MAAVTTTMAVAGGVAGLGLNIADAIKAQKAREQAQKAAAQAAAKLTGIKELDAFGSVQVPTLGYELAQQTTDRATKGAMEAARGAGAEGVIGATGNILAQANEQALNVAKEQGETKLQRDLYQAQNKAEIEQRRAQREQDIYSSELSGAQQAAADAQARKDAAITGAIESGIGLAGDIYSSTDLYKSLNPDPLNKDKRKALEQFFKPMMISKGFRPS